MKKSVLVFSMASLLFIGGLNMVSAQEQPAPKKDTVNMDTDAKPQFYYAVEDDKTMPKTATNKTTEIIVIVAGVVVIVGAVVFFLLKKKK
jgi:LPXTG-motif cell wall-anchored protein